MTCGFALPVCLLDQERNTLVSITSKLRGLRSLAFKSVGVAVAIAFGVSTMVAAPASASAPANDFDVWHYQEDYDTAYVCFDESSGDSLYFDGDTELSVDFYHSDSYYTEHPTQVTFVYDDTWEDEECWYANGVQVGKDIWFTVSNDWIITTTVDRPGAGSSYYAEDTSGEWGWNHLRVQANIAYEADDVANERTTAVLCVEPYNNSYWDNQWGEGNMDFLDGINVRTENITNGDFEDLSWDYATGLDLCDEGDDYELYVYGLTLGDTYEFHVDGVINNYGRWCPDGCYDYWWNVEYFETSSSNWYTPLDVHSAQWSLFDADNGGCDGSCEASDDVWGNGDNYARLWVDTPSYTDGYNFSNMSANWETYDRYWDEWYDEWKPASCVGNYCWNEGGYGDTYRMGNNDFDGQGYVWADYGWDSDEWVFEGLSDTYIDNMNLDWNSDWVRATSPTSVELVLETGMTKDWVNSYEEENDVNTNSYLDPSEATYYIRATPNDGSRDYEEVVQYTGNETNRPTRYETIDYVFYPQPEEGQEGYTTLGLVDYDYWNGARNFYYDQGAVKFNLTGLQPGTTYDIEYLAVVPYTNERDSEDRDNGDGGYNYVQFRDAAAWHFTTELASKVDQVTTDSARYLIDVTDSHMNTTNLQKNAMNGFYYSLNECYDNPGYWDGSYWVDAFSDCNEIDNSEWETRFDSDHTTASKISTDAGDLISMADGHLYVPITVQGLKPDHRYELVAGFDYWAVNGVQTNSNWWWTDSSVDYSQTLDGSRCDGDVFQDFEDTDFGAQCYNGTTWNDIFRTDIVSFRTLDDVAPVVEGGQITDNGEGEAVIDSDIYLWFSEAITPGNGTVSLHTADGALVRSFNTKSSPLLEIVEGSGLVIHNTGFLDYSKHYYVEISEGAYVDASGNATPGATVYYFQTAPTDTYAPVVESVVTVDNEGDGVDTNTNFTITFDEDVMAGAGVVEIRRTSNDAVVRTLVANASKQVSIDGNVVTIDGGDLLDYATGYYLHIAEGAFVDDHGNASAADASYTFTTEKQPVHLGDVKISASYSGGWRDLTLTFGDEMAGQVVDVYWVSRHTDKKRLVRSIQLDDNGDAVISAQIVRFEKLDGIQVMFGRHAIAWETAKKA